MNYSGLHLSMQQFYRSAEWSNTRKQFLALCREENRPFVCNICRIPLCYASAPEDKKIGKGILNIDHVLPIKKYWEKRFDLDNLQLLCHDCNKAKANLTDPKEILEAVNHERNIKKKLRAKEEEASKPLSDEVLLNRVKHAWGTGKIPQWFKRKPIDPNKPKVLRKANKV